MITWWWSGRCREASLDDFILGDVRRAVLLTKVVGVPVDPARVCVGIPVYGEAPHVAGTPVLAAVDRRQTGVGHPIGRV